MFHALRLRPLFIFKSSTDYLYHTAIISIKKQKQKLYLKQHLKIDIFSILFAMKQKKEPFYFAQD